MVSALWVNDPGLPRLCRALDLVPPASHGLSGLPPLANPASAPDTRL